MIYSLLGALVVGYGLYSSLGNVIHGEAGVIRIDKI